MASPVVYDNSISMAEAAATGPASTEILVCSVLVFCVI